MAADVADDLPALAARIVGMEEARMTALEQRIEADLAAGQHRALVAELAELAAGYPLREQFRAYQMVALYRCGRQAEALSAFHQLRHELATELGVDPSPQLGALYEAMLRADPLVARPDPPACVVEPNESRFGDGQAELTAADLPPLVTLGQRAAADEARQEQIPGRPTPAPVHHALLDDHTPPALAMSHSRSPDVHKGSGAGHSSPYQTPAPADLCHRRPDQQDQMPPAALRRCRQ